MIPIASDEIGVRSQNITHVTMSIVDSLTSTTTTTTNYPTQKPSLRPTGNPIVSVRASSKPTRSPVARPTRLPTVKPVKMLTGPPTKKPTKFPIAKPTFRPTTKPIPQPTEHVGEPNIVSTQNIQEPTATPILVNISKKENNIKIGLHSAIVWIVGVVILVCTGVCCLGIGWFCWGRSRVSFGSKSKLKKKGMHTSIAMESESGSETPELSSTHHHLCQRHVLPRACVPGPLQQLRVWRQRPEGWGSLHQQNLSQI